MSKEAETHFVNEFSAMLNRLRMEYTMTYAQVLGCIELIRADIIEEAREAE